MKRKELTKTFVMILNLYGFSKIIQHYKGKRVGFKIVRENQIYSVKSRLFPNVFAHIIMIMRQAGRRPKGYIKLPWSFTPRIIISLYFYVIVHVRFFAILINDDEK